MATKTLPVQSNYGTLTAKYSADFLRAAVVEAKVPFNALTPYYVAAVCAGMEGALNNCFVEHLHRKLGKSYTAHLRPFLFMKIQDRLELAPLLLSNYKYKLNDKCPYVKKALKLFDMRNHFLHIKDLWHYADVEFNSEGDIVGWQYLVKEHPDPYREGIGSDLVAKVSI